MRTCLSTYLSVHLLYIHICLYKYIYVHINKMCEHTCMLEDAFGCMCVCKHIDIYVSMRSCEHIDIHIIHMYVRVDDGGENTNQKNIG